MTQQQFIYLCKSSLCDTIETTDDGKVNCILHNECILEHEYRRNNKMTITIDSTTYLISSNNILRRILSIDNIIDLKQYAKSLMVQ